MSTVFESRFSIGNVISQSLSVYGRNFVSFGILALIIVGIPEIVIGLIQPPEMLNPAAAIMGGSGFGVFIPVFIAGVVYFLLSFVLYAALAYGTFRDLSGAPASIGELVGRGLSRALPVLAVSLLSGLGMMLGFILLVVPGLILLCMWAVVVPVSVVEAPGIVAAMSRSAELTKGYRWHIFGTIIIYYIVLAIISGILLAITFLVSASMPMLGSIVSAVVNSLTVAFTAVTLTVIYGELRRVKEGVDVTQIAQVFD